MSWRQTWALLLDHLWQILLVDEENQTTSSEQQEEPERTGQPPSPSSQGVHHHLPLHPQHDAAQSEPNVISSAKKSKEVRNEKRRIETQTKVERAKQVCVFRFPVSANFAGEIYSQQKWPNALWNFKESILLLYFFVYSLHYLLTFGSSWLADQTFT